MKTYHHTQRGTVILVALAVATVLAAAGGLALRPVLIVVPVLVIGAWLFHSLTIEVAEGELRWRFGPGWIRKRVPLDLILSAEPVRTNVIEGWGIHLSRFGWLYNVSGRDAVAVRMKNGRHFALGTDQPEALCAALRSGCGTIAG
jgi:hypothetical protein